VAVDIRAASPTFRKWVACELSADAFNQLFIPVGFAHGFVTLEPNTAVLYKVSAPYSAQHDHSIRWDDPSLAIDWGLTQMPLLSDKDETATLLNELPAIF
jgi:dTDP-4-dehydrorhamnose 3,5-epimerase